MKRFFLLWLTLLAIEASVAGVMSMGVLHSVDARFEPFLTGLVAPAVQAALLLWFFPRLRDPGFVTPGAALRSRPVAATAIVLLGAAAVLTVLVVLRVASERAFDIARGVASVAGSVAFLVAGWRRVRGAFPAAAILVFLSMTTGRAEQIAEHLLTAQPMGIRWLAFGVASAAAVLAVLFHAVSALRESSPHASTLLEWSLAPAMLTAFIVLANFFWRPFLTPGSSLAANASGLAAVGLALLASIASLQRSA